MRTPPREIAAPTSGLPTAAPPAIDRTPDHYRAGAGLAVLGAVLLVVGTWLHPIHADPGNPTLAFAEYAAVSRAAWLSSHLTQLAGVAGMALAMVVLSRAVAPGTVWSRVTAACGAAAVAVAAVLQAVDGVALKAMVDLWSDGTTEERPVLFAAALAVRQVEVGLAGMSAILLAATTLGFGLVLLTAASGNKALAVLAIAAAGTAAVGATLMCLEGFSAGAMDVSLGSGGLGLLAMLAVAVWSWRRAAVPRRQP